MAGKRNVRESTPSVAAAVNTAAALPQRAQKAAGGWDKMVNNMTSYYDEQTPQRTKLIDAFMAFLALAGALQFLYCVLAGNFVCGDRIGGM